ncbi:hypothetical protein [Corynebacterium glutamicum]|uniref:hypothetical protein n=1 Tax=Corynebacterium glutamicum TaxID=1718 RepID=UPI000942CE68|nr:hypothetical protein [Corynebacterium glutamicum]OKX85127.1 hypothetical protein AUO95_00920 [Corynebacterium glutamicum]
MAKITVFSPVKNFSGVSVGITFSHGVGVVEEGSAAHKYFQRRGYAFSLEEDRASQSPGASQDLPEGGKTAEKEGASTPPDIDIPGMPGAKALRSEWIAFAESLGIETESLTIPQIRERIIVEHLNAPNV